MNRTKPGRALSTQIMASLYALVVLTALAVGLPSIWLIRNQLDRQAWSLLEQGSSTTRALYEARQSELLNLAILIAQRPTLVSLVGEGSASETGAYLETLRLGAGLDVILLCSPGSQAMAQAGGEAPGDVCTVNTNEVFYRVEKTPALQAWILASQPVLEAQPGTRVVAGYALGDRFVRQMRSQTQLEHTLLNDGEIIATSFESGLAAWDAMRTSRPASTLQTAGQETGRSRFSLDDELYYSLDVSLNGEGLANMVSLPVGEIAGTQRQLTMAIAGSIAGVSVLCFIIGSLLAGRISRPLSRLEKAARALRKGDLTKPVGVDLRVSEVSQVAYALEDARIALHHSLNEMRREKDWTDHLLEAIVEGIVTLDQRGQITYFSPGAERITGWKKENATGLLCDEVFRLAEEGETFSSRMPAAGKRQKMVIAMPDGRQVTLAVTGARLAPPEAGRARVALVLRDVSDEEALHRLLGDFLANVAHEFRTPLSALAASMELLLYQLPDLTLDDLNSLLDSVRLGVLNLQTLIDNLLEGASIEAGRFRVYARPADLAEIINDAVRTMKPLADKHGLRIVTEMPGGLPPVSADPRRTCQVVVNLLSNAVKHGP
ncbi:MAG: sensor histidine kinase, partial [Chloroflexota bacterium]